MSTGESQPDTPKPLPVIGSYRLIQQLGSGGMSSVFRAVHVQSGAEVAVKILPRRLAQNPTLLQRFLNEAKSAERLQHPNIVAIFDRGFDQGRHYLVLEFVKGGDLQDRVRNEGPLPIDDAVRVVREVAEGLRYAGRQGVIHRDIKPANLLLPPTGHVKIIDLGLAVETEDEDERVTRDGTTVGTVDYMSPEQARNSRATSEASDIYSLGCTFYYLLTGSPPFPGGDIFEKLKKHAIEPIPDIRAKRPEAPQSLALLVKRMMAKTPLQRFGSHTELLAALNALKLDAPTTDGGGQPLMALIVDDEDELVDAPIALLPDPNFTLPSKPVAPAPEPTPDHSVNLADLVGIEDEPPTKRRPVRPPSMPSVLMAEIVEDSEDDIYEVPTSKVTRSRGPGFIESTTSLKTFIGIGVAIGLAIALVGFGLIQLFIAFTDEDRSKPLPEVKHSAEEGGNPDELANGKGETVPPPIETTPTKTASATEPSKNEKGPRPSPGVWVEPVDPAPRVATDNSLSPPIESSYLPAWARTGVARISEGTPTVVRRADDSARTGEVSVLRQALSKPNETIEIADDGPFFESDWSLTGPRRLIKAGPGFRPILVIGSASAAGSTERLAPFQTEGIDLTFQGVDLVVDLKTLPVQQSALFLCRGGSLRFIDCTLTLLNSAGRSFTVAQFSPASDSKPGPSSQVVFQRSLVRGLNGRLLELGAVSADVLIRDSVVAAEAGPVITLLPAASSVVRRLFAVESVVATNSSFVEWPGSTQGALVLRAFRSVLAKASPTRPGGLFHARSEGSGAGLNGLDLIAEECRLAGWPVLVSAGSSARSRVADVNAMLKLSSKSLVRCSLDKSQWDAKVFSEDLNVADLTLLPALSQHAAFLDAVARPTPWIKQKTIEPWVAPTVPELVYVASPARGANQKLVELTFNVENSHGGDLGLFLRSQKFAPAIRTRVVIQGAGARLMTPVQIPDRVCLEIVGPATLSKENALSWSAAKGDTTEPLIRIKNGSLSLTNIVLGKGDLRRVNSIIEAENSHLVLSNCQLRTAAGADLSRGALVSFKTSGSKPLPTADPTPFVSAVAHPHFFVLNSVFLASQDALSMEIGVGKFILINSLVMSDHGAALTFRPAKVARARFEVDSRVENSTLVASKTLLRLGAWPGAQPGPERPWVVWSHATLFQDVAARTKPEAVLLRANVESLSHNVMAWQGDSNFFDVFEFRATSDLTPSFGRDRADLGRLWTDYWGVIHVQSSAGPRVKTPGVGRSETPTLRFLTAPNPGAERLPGDFALDPKVHPGLGADFKVLPLLPEQIRKP